jgi:hypothetical protein
MKKIPSMKILILLAFAIAAAVFFFLNPARKKKARDGKEAVATLDDKSMKYLRFKFNAEGKEISFSKKVVPEIYGYFFIGEKFIVQYAEGDPDNKLLFLNKPVIDESSFGRTSTTLVEEKQSIIYFEYTVEGNTYKRFQYFDMENAFDPAPYTGKHYLVRYNTLHPEIGYVNLDSVTTLDSQ